ncbi:hypothetical protein D3C79_1108610 [compost metagenome]
MAKTKTRPAFDDQEFFGFGMVIVTTPGDTGMCGKIRKLTRILGLEHLHEDTAGVSILGNFVSEIFRR